MDKYRPICIFLLCLIVLAPVRGGSLYDETLYEPLVTDHRAHAVGDLLTILIYESASSSTSADTDTNKSLDVNASARFDDSRHAGELAIANNYAGGGSITRSGRLVASVSVTIQSVLPNGELDVKGEQEIEFNDEYQYILVEGRVRPEDIRTDNSVLSTRVADAKIKYVGEGLLGSRQEPGLISNFFNWLF